MSSKTKIIRVIPELNFLSEKTASEQFEWINCVDTMDKAKDLEKALNGMADQNLELRKRIEELKEEKEQLRTGITNMSSYINDLKAQIKPSQETFAAKLSNGTEFTLSVPFQKQSAEREQRKFDLTEALGEKNRY